MLPIDSFTTMDRQLIQTDDGSATIFLPSLQVAYHSRHGAVGESLHVFIGAGYHYWSQNNPQAPCCRIFEMGFGTGLNALLTLIAGEQAAQKISYTAIEASPLALSLVQQLRYGRQLHCPEPDEIYNRLHTCPWETENCITPLFNLRKIKASMQDFSGGSAFDIIYYDAFAPNAQPELWTEAIFLKLHNMLQPGGILVTYCSKGAVQRALKAAGFVVEKLPGPPGKREMVRGCNSIQTSRKGVRHAAVLFIFQQNAQFL